MFMQIINTLLFKAFQEVFFFDSPFFYLSLTSNVIMYVFFYYIYTQDPRKSLLSVRIKDILYSFYTVKIVSKNRKFK